VKNRQATVELVSDVIATRTVKSWVEIFEQASVPCSAISTLDKMYEHPQASARGTIMPYDHPVAGPMRAVAYPAKIDGMPRTVRRAPPGLGQHTDEVLGDLGFSADEVEKLYASDAVGRVER